MNNKSLHIAPMMGLTTCHFRYLMRMLAPSCILYTEMITAQTLTHGNPSILLEKHQKEYPIVCQLGGSDPKMLAKACKIVAEFGYDEINLNCGCPSSKVQQAQIGAILYKNPKKVQDCLIAMQEATQLPVSLKCRIGVDDMDSMDHLMAFIELCSQQKLSSVQIHARKAWLDGLNPKQNRNIPPLEYDKVLQIAKAFPHLPIILNGGLNQIEDIKPHLPFVSGVMIGRRSTQSPLDIWKIAQYLSKPIQASPSEFPSLHRDIVQKILVRYCDYLMGLSSKGARRSPSFLLKPLQNFFSGTRYNKPWKKTLHTFLQKEQTASNIGLNLLQYLQSEEHKNWICAITFLSS